MNRLKVWFTTIIKCSDNIWKSWFILAIICLAIQCSLQIISYFVYHNFINWFHIIVWGVWSIICYWKLKKSK